MSSKREVISIYRDEIVDPQEFKAAIKSEPIEIRIYGNEDDKLIAYILDKLSKKGKLIEYIEEKVPKGKSSVDRTKFRHTPNRKRKVPKTTNRGTTDRHWFMSENWNIVKKEMGFTQSKDILKELAKRWNKIKGKKSSKKEESSSDEDEE